MRSCKAVFSTFSLLLFLLFSISSQAAEGIINDVQFHGNNDGSESVTFHLNSASLPKVFALKGEKPRVVFDFMETQLAKAVPSVVNTDGHMVEKIRMGRHSEKTRVVFDLASSSVVNFDQDFDASRNILTIRLFSADYPSKKEKAVEEITEVQTAEELVEIVETVEVTEEVVETPVIISSVEAVIEEERITETEDVVDIVPVAEDNPLSPEALLSEVNFENTSNKGEMVLFKLNGFYPPEVSGEENGNPKVTCVFAGARMGADLVREQSPQGEFIEKIIVEQADELAPIQVVLKLVPNKNYDLQQVFFKEDNLFVIIVNSYDTMAEPAE